jgi:hypothetical protein
MNRARELEAFLESAKCWKCGEDAANLAALKARRCGGCTHSANDGGCPVYDAAWVTFGVVPFSCACWTPRED